MDLVAKELINKLQNISIRILILEMRYLKSQNKLKGEDSQEEYTYFCDYWLNNTKYLNQLFRMYPPLFSELAKAAYKYLAYILEIIEHLSTDKTEIETYIIGKSFEKISLIECKDADSHNNGKQVARILFDNGESVYYKPRDLSSDLMFSELYLFVTGKSYPLKILNRGTYGWESAVKFEECKSEYDVKCAYYNLGVCISIFSILGISDLHFSNAILSRDMVVFVDIEVMRFLKSIEGGMDKHIYMTGILPINLWSGKKRNCDYSIIGSKNRQKTYYKFPVIINKFSSDMHIVYQNKILYRKESIITYQGLNISAFQYISYIQQGYKDAYRSIENSQEFIKILNKYENTNWRYLLQDSQIYATLIRYSFFPQIMTRNKRKELFEKEIYNQTNLDSYDKIFLSQIEQLENSDIPYFYTKFNKKDLYDNSQIVKKNYLMQSGIEYVKNNIKNMNKKRMYIGSSTIYWMVYFGDQGINAAVDRCIETDKLIVKNSKPKNLIGEQNKIVESIVRRKIDSSAKTDWISLLFYNEGYVKLMLVSEDNYLYNGIAGIAVYLVALSCEKDYIKYKELSDILIKRLFLYTDTVYRNSMKRQSNRIGAYDGEASIIYAYQILYQLTKDNIFIQYAEKHIGFLHGLLSEENISQDIVSGRAGVVLVLCNMYKLNKNRVIKELLLEQGNILYSNLITNDETQPGFAHGYYGIIMVLIRMLATMGEVDGKKYVENILQYVRRKEKSILPNQMCKMESWCHGNLGKLLYQIELYKLNSCKSNELKKEIENTIRKILKSELRKSMCLCHGNVGKIEILFQCAIQLGDNKLKKYCIQKVNEYLDESKNVENRLIQERNNVGFMIGISGIGYSLLRFNNYKLPFILGGDI